MKGLLKQLFGPMTGHIVAWAVVLIASGAFVHMGLIIEPVLLICLWVAIGYIAAKNMFLALCLAFAEVFFGGHGHILSMSIAGQSISLRMGIFAVIMAVWLCLFVRKKIAWEWVRERDLPWVMLISAVAIGTCIGLLQNETAAVIDDMNGYAFIFYALPLASIRWTHSLRRLWLQVAAASAVIVTVATLVLSYLFTHLPGLALDTLYQFVRDTRNAEVTLQVFEGAGGISKALMSPAMSMGLLSEPYWYRVFMPSQSTLLMALIILLSFLFLARRGSRLDERIWLLFIAFAAGLILSWSRSFYLAGALVAAGLFGYAMFTGKRRARVLLRGTGTVIIGGFALMLVWLTVAFPFPARPDLTQAAFYETSAEVGRVAGVQSRWALLPEMMDAIYASPILGSGFGEVVTYETADPRICDVDCTYETYRFEWGWQDVWLKMGLAGLLAYGWYLVALTRTLRDNMKRRGHAWLLIGLYAGIVALFITHIFSPYLNHPIGLAWMLFVLPFFDYTPKSAVEEKEKGRQEKRQMQSAVAAAIHETM